MAPFGSVEEEGTAVAVVAESPKVVWSTVLE
jgi:hypothetical protein